jgi:secernin
MVILMCDTLVQVSADGVLFAKNSDRDANESQTLEWIPAASHDSASALHCTWIEIPQALTTNAVLLSRPWWMWGAEMGANEHGVVIGNEAVFTTEPKGEPALLGMDLLRLALERAHDAQSAASVIVELLERHGQGGPCSHERPGFTYDNSFLIADSTSAIVLETAGSRWATEEVRSGARSISNGLTIPGFAQKYSRRLRSKVSACAVRRALTETQAGRATGPRSLMATLRDHGGGAPRWSPINGTLHAPCVHAGGWLASSQTTASMVSDLRGDPLHWVSATSAPCTSIFKPARVDEPVALGPAPTDRFDPATLWWRHELLHRAVLADYPRHIQLLQTQRDAVEAEWVASPPSTTEAFALAARLEQTWLEQIDGPLVDRRPWWVRSTWRDLDKCANMPVTP